MAIEREVKLLSPRPLTVAEVRAVVAATGLRAGRVRHESHRDVYLDSDRSDLAGAGASLRLRTGRGRRILAWKTAGRVRGGVHEREEIEVRFSGGVPPLHASGLPDAIRHRAGPLLLCRALGPVAEVVSDRQDLPLREVRSGARAVLSLDDASVVDGGREIARFFEVEIEWAGGPAEPWRRLAGALRNAFGLTSSRASKLERALAARGRPGPARAAGRGIRPGMTLAEAGRAVFRHHAARARAAEARSRSGDPDGVHDHRVALRRLRAAFKTFAAAFPRRSLKPFARIARSESDALGRIRDLDVFLDGSPELIGGLDAALRRAGAAIVRTVRARREREQARLLSFLESPRRLRSAERLWALCDEAPSPPSVLDRRIEDVAPALLLDSARRVQRRARSLKEMATTRALHRLRLTLKRLRYDAEAVAQLYGRRLERLVAGITALQDRLGAAQDDNVAAAALPRWIRSRGRPPAASFRIACSALIALLQARARRNRAQFQRAWPAFRPARLARRIREALR